MATLIELDRRHDAIETFLEIAKAIRGERAGHKYIRRVAKPGGGYSYVYKEPDDLAPSQQEQYVQDPPEGEIKPVSLPPGVSIDEYKLTVNGQGAKEVADKLRAAIKTSSDLCKISPPVCTKNLGIPRAKMPQLSDEVTDKFIQALRDRGIKIEEGIEHVGNLKATQGEINAEKVTGMITAIGEGKYDPSGKPFIVSRDGYVLDGHHRWASMLLLDPDNRMKVMKVDMDAKDLVNEANSFEGVEQAPLAAGVPRGNRHRRAGYGLYQLRGGMQEKLAASLRDVADLLKAMLEEIDDEGTPEEPAVSMDEMLERIKNHKVEEEEEPEMDGG